MTGGTTGREKTCHPCLEDTGRPTLEVRVADSMSPAAAPDSHLDTLSWCWGVDLIGQQLLSKTTEMLPQQLWLVPESLLKEHILKRTRAFSNYMGSNSARLQMALIRKTLKVLPPNYSKCCSFGEEPGMGTVFLVTAIRNKQSWEGAVQLQEILTKNCSVISKVEASTWLPL